MKKNVFSKSLAVIASAAVLSVAGALSASAAGEAYVIGDATGKAGETVTVQVSVSGGGLTAMGSTFSYPAELTFVSGEKAATESGATVDVTGGSGTVDILGYADAAAPIQSAVANVSFTIPADAEAGTTYTLEWTRVDELVMNDADVSQTAALTAGTITVEATETEPAPTEPAPTEAPKTEPAPTEAPKTEAPTTTTAKPKKTASPKTGSKGVAVAFAGLAAAAATAVVVKSRKD